MKNINTHLIKFFIAKYITFKLITIYFCTYSFTINNMSVKSDIMSHIYLKPFYKLIFFDLLIQQSYLFVHLS